MTGQELLALYKDGERVFSGINLEGADLAEADLRYVDLSGANLRGSDLRGVILQGASLSRADLTGVHLGGANLSDADLGGAILQGANLRGSGFEGAILQGANFEGAKLDYQIQEGLLAQIAKKVLADPSSLNMNDWHSCKTVHCIAGWACYLNPVARELEKTHGTAVAALLVLGPEAQSHFWDLKEEALVWLKTKI